MGFGGKRRKSKSASRWAHAPHHPRARARFAAFNAAMAEAVRRTNDLLSRAMLSGAEMGEDGTIRFRPFMPAFTIRIGVKP